MQRVLGLTNKKSMLYVPFCPGSITVDDFVTHVKLLEVGHHKQRQAYQYTQKIRQNITMNRSPVQRLIPRIQSSVAGSR